jgi:curved DNA-binding protein CbpA
VKDLYSALGISKDAPHAEVRRAYRREAKKSHPDAGGDPAKFALVSLAHDVLGDTERRAEYDRTGNVDEKPQDKSLSCVMQVIDEVLNKCARRGIDPSNVDIISDAQKSLHIKLEKMNEQYKTGLAQIASAKKLAKRFKPKKGKVNRIAALIEGRIRQAEEAARKSIEDRPSIERALEILSDHTFDFERVDGYSGSTMNTQRVMNMAFGA